MISKKENDSAIDETIREFINVDLDDWIERERGIGSDPKFVEMARKFLVLANREMGFSEEPEKTIGQEAMQE
jgi:hypothetical protein